MNVLSNLNEYRKSSKLCDLTLTTGTSVLNAHKAVVAASCEYFAQALEGDSATVKVDFIDSDDLEIVLNYIYTDEIPLTHENVDKFSEIAQRLNFSKLANCCESFQSSPISNEPIIENITVENIETVDIADQSPERIEPTSIEIKRSKPVSIFPITKRSERKAKQNAYKTMNDAFRIMGDSEDNLDVADNHHSSDEDYCFENTTPSAIIPVSVRNTKRRRSSKMKAYLCPTCNKCFNQIMTYQLHVLCHDDNPTNKDEFAINSSKLKENMEQVEFEKCGFKPEIMPRKPHLTCDICSKMFTTAHNLSVHLNTHKKVDKDSTAKKAKKQHTCSVCLKVFGSKSHLRRHMLTHNGVRNHCCTTCGKLFLKNDHLKRHERTHTDERPFACEECGKTFRDKDHLKRHYLTHSDFRPFFCEICGKQFKERNTLQSHIKLHSATALACPHCSKTFKTSDALSRHVERHAQKKDHVCEVCGKNFPFVGRLKKHMLTHTGDRPHHCDTCSKQFRDAHSLKLHQKKHTGIGLHRCAECGKDFTNQFHLKRHERVHTGEKPFRCDLCNRTFSRIDNLEAHKRSCLMKKQGTELVPAVSQVMWNNKDRNLIPVHTGVYQAEESPVLPVLPNNDDITLTSSSTSPVNSSNPTSQFSANLQSLTMTANPPTMVNHVRSKFYNLPTQLYSQSLVEEPHTQSYQLPSLQMPAPLHASAPNIIQNTQQQQQQAQQLVNFDVNSGVNSYIGYETLL